MKNDDDLLQALSSEARRVLLGKCRRRVCAPGEVLVRQGSKPQALFRIHSGFARAQNEHLGIRVELARMEPGAWFGELSLLDGAPASADVVAETRVEVDELSQESLAQFIAEAPGVAADLYRALGSVLARRLRRLTAALPERLFDDDRDGTSLVDSYDLPSYLAETPFCDFGQRDVRALASRLRADATSDADFARRAFYWVRDEVAYSLGLSADRASQTLRNRRGSCSHKANLFVALMRAAGIPSGYHFMFVKTREYLGPVVNVRLQRFLSLRSVHVLAAALLSDRWVRCDPSDDARLSDAIGHFNPPTRKIEFDGRTDAMLHLAPETIEYYDATCWPTIDTVLTRTPRIAPIALSLLNIYMEWGRSFGKQFDDPATAWLTFLGWLREHRPDDLTAFEVAESELLSSAGGR